MKVADVDDECLNFIPLMFCSQTLNEQLCVQIAETVRNPAQDRNQRFLAASFSRQDPGRARTYARPGLKDMY
jgi:hypothetical protein